MREVPVLLFRAMRRTFERYGVDTTPHLRGLSLATVPAWAIGGRVDWDELATFLERCAEPFSAEEQERIGELYPLENHFLQFIVRSVLSPQMFHRLVWRNTKPAFPHLEIRLDELSDRHAVLHLELPRRYRGSTVFFRGTIGECRTMTELLGLGPSEVEADASPWHGHYVIRFPGDPEQDDLREASRRLLRDRQWRLPTLIGWLFGHESGRGEAMRERLERAHGLSAVEATIIVRLGEGASVPEIAHELGIGRSELEALLGREHDRLSDAVRAELVDRVVGG